MGDPDLIETGGLSCRGESGQDNCISRLKGRWALTPSGAVSSGRWHTCAIRCEGNNPALEYTDQWVLGNSTSLGWGGVVPSTCTQGRVVCWGDDQMHQGNSGLQAQGLADFNDFISVCSAVAHSCGVRSGGELHCWGYYGNNRAVIPELYNYYKWQSVRCKVGCFLIFEVGE